MNYQGSCHCQAVKFELVNVQIDQALKCNCSICSRKNAVMSKEVFSAPQFVMLQGEGNLAVYQWGDKDVNHLFCKTCGIYPFHSTQDSPESYRVNLGCLEQLDITSLEVIEFNGRDLL